MAQILKHQTSLNEEYERKRINGTPFFKMGFILIAIAIIGVTLVFVSDLSFIISLIIGVILFIMGILGAIIFIIGMLGEWASSKSSFLKGAEGEKIVSDILETYPDNWYIFNDMRIGTAQIDHIVICPKGVYTIETKNYKGTIYGNAEDRYWTQVIESEYVEDRPYKFYNPIEQGKKHSFELSKYLSKYGYKSVIHTIVVFTTKSKLKVFSHKVPVIQTNEIYNYFDKQNYTLSQTDTESIVNCILKSIPEN
ncbi:MAG TPA: hypothetical protein C5S51_08535 [Methanosarcinaceae archaeon]|nr:hypothetical protein [Methanosarcinaceae archaeon]